MVIGNGFFTDSRSEAVEEMRRRSGCEVCHVPLEALGNIDYYVSEKGDLYGVQRVGAAYVTRTKTPVRHKRGFTARLSESPNKEIFVPLAVVMYCAFVTKRWEPDIQIEFSNGNQYDCKMVNIRKKTEVIPPEWNVRMDDRKDVYKSHFLDVCYSVNYTSGLNIQDCKDIVQSVFLYLCTRGYTTNQYEGEGFVGLWIKCARHRAIDFLKTKNGHSSLLLERVGRRDKFFEFDFFALQDGVKRQKYLRMYMEGNKPTEIARECGVSLGTVSCSVSRSIQFMQKYFKRDIEIWQRKR